MHVISTLFAKASSKNVQLAYVQPHVSALTRCAIVQEGAQVAKVSIQGTN